MRSKAARPRRASEESPATGKSGAKSTRYWPKRGATPEPAGEKKRRREIAETKGNQDQPKGAGGEKRASQAVERERREEGEDGEEAKKRKGTDASSKNEITRPIRAEADLTRAHSESHSWQDPTRLVLSLRSQQGLALARGYALGTQENTVNLDPPRRRLHAGSGWRTSRERGRPCTEQAGLRRAPRVRVRP